MVTLYYTLISWPNTRMVKRPLEPMPIIGLQYNTFSWAIKTTHRTFYYLIHHQDNCYKSTLWETETTKRYQDKLGRTLAALQVRFKGSPY